MSGTSVRKVTRARIHIVVCISVMFQKNCLSTTSHKSMFGMAEFRDADVR